MNKDRELGVVLFCRGISLWARLAFVFVLAAKPVASLVCPLGRPIFLFGRLLHDYSIIILECIAFCGREDLCQSLVGSDSQFAV
ncbi:unnamed protein product [Prunus armeniaca]